MDIIRNETFHEGAMRLPRMTMWRWIVLIAFLAVGLTLIVQRASHPLATIAFFFGWLIAILRILMYLRWLVSADD
jgi:hypothetical protein